jgi:hypothetical protein
LASLVLFLTFFTWSLVPIHNFEGNLLTQKQFELCRSGTFAFKQSPTTINFQYHTENHLHQNSNPGHFLGVVIFASVISSSKQTISVSSMFFYHN